MFLGTCLVLEHEIYLLRGGGEGGRGGRGKVRGQETKVSLRKIPMRNWDKLMNNLLSFVFYETPFVTVHHVPAIMRDLRW